MLSAKSVIDAAANEIEEYLLVEFDNCTQIEIDGDKMTLFVTFSTNQKSLWNMMVRQTDDNFKFINEIQPTEVGRCFIERAYSTPADPRFGVLLCNDLIDSTISIQMTTYVSERALDKFFDWIPTPAGCCKLLAEALQLSIAERSQEEHHSAGLRGDPSH